MTWLKRLSQVEPAIIRGALVSVLAFLALFGFEWATEANAITATNAIVAILPILAGLAIRPSVTPNVKVGAEDINPHDDGPSLYEAGEAAVYPEGTPVDVVLEDSPASKDYPKD